MKTLLLGGHPALDFLNTAFAPDRTPIEMIVDGRAFLAWLTAAGLLQPSEAKALRQRFGATALDQSAGEARRMREWARAWVQRWRSNPKGDYKDEIAELNQLLARGSYFHQIGPPLTLTTRRRLDNADALLAVLADALAALVTGEDAQLVKSCAGPGCTLMFLDRTKAHRRLFCSATACGNRAKVAAFRARERGRRQ